MIEGERAAEMSDGDELRHTDDGKGNGVRLFGRFYKVHGTNPITWNPPSRPENDVP